MAKLREVAKYVRSKNAGPFWVTLEIFCEGKTEYDRIAHSPSISPLTISQLYHVDAQAVQFYYIPSIFAIKISFPRPYPSGYRYERDMLSNIIIIVLAILGAVLEAWVGAKIFGLYRFEAALTVALCACNIGASGDVQMCYVCDRMELLPYPDVTLLEPLASALGLRIEGLMACRRQAAGGGEEDPVKNLLTISSSSLRRERRRSWGVVAGVLAFMLIVTLLVGYNLLYMTETRQDSIVLKETVDGENYLYMEEKGHLLRLRCGKDVDFDAIALDDGYCPLVYEVELRWNRLTYTGTAISCTTTGTISLGSPMDTDPYWQEATLFGSAVLYATDDYYPDPYAEPAGRRFLCDFYVKEMGLPSASRTILLVEDCISGTVADVDDDGENEAVVRTRWPEKPYTVYDYVDGEIVETWPDTLPEAVLESLVQF